LQTQSTDLLTCSTDHLKPKYVKGSYSTGRAFFWTQTREKWRKS